MKKEKLLTRAEQRARQTALVMAGATLELQLGSLTRRALDGDRDALAEFQQAIQYAPLETRARIAALIDHESENKS